MAWNETKQNLVVHVKLDLSLISVRILKVLTSNTAVRSQDSPK